VVAIFSFLKFSTFEACTRAKSYLHEPRSTTTNKSENIFFHFEKRFKNEIIGLGET
jgi:hypothetical protein